MVVVVLLVLILVLKVLVVLVLGGGGVFCGWAAIEVLGVFPLSSSIDTSRQHGMGNSLTLADQSR